MSRTIAKAEQCVGCDSPASQATDGRRETSQGTMIGTSCRLVEILKAVDRVAPTMCNVLITGESGTGKELLAAALHDASGRSGPLVTVNCGALPECLMESELFGHTRGAFTGALQARQGRLAAAEGGTLFWDEIGELPLNLQAKLLRVLQQREYSPVGDDRVVRCDVRNVAATNRKLADEVQRGNFRADLFYRLNVVKLHLPALRQRPEDLDALITHFYEDALSQVGRDDLDGFDEQAISVLKAHDWPGNVRELQNVITRTALLAPGPTITRNDVPLQLPPGAEPLPAVSPGLPDAGIDLRQAVAQFESNLIRQALDRTEWNKNRAAQLLGMNRTTLVEKIKRRKLLKCG